MNHLVIGNKNYSSWSLRPWILLKEKGIEFKETKIPLYLQNSREQILKYSPAAKVPVYFYKETPVWDSLAICETIAEIYPEKHCWPQSFDMRAIARSVSFEMHSGFHNIRETLPMNCRTKMKFAPIKSELQAEIDRICDIWKTCRKQNPNAGEFLFGEFSIADAMYAPIVIRFDRYGIDVGAVEKQYIKSILSLESTQQWIDEAISEREIIEQAELG